MTRSRFLSMGLLLLALPACAARGRNATAPLVATEGCPVVLLTRTGGLGFESQSGILAAVWPSGTIVRARTEALPRRGHVIGRLRDAALEELLRQIRADRFWDEPTGTAALDMPDDALSVRRNGEVRRWVETPGVTSTPAVTQMRELLFGLTIEKPRRLAEPLDEARTCLTADQ